MGPSLEIRYKRYLRAAFPDGFHRSLAARVSSGCLRDQPLSVLQHDFVFLGVRWGPEQARARVLPAW